MCSIAYKTMLNTDNIYIVRIENIPKNYEAIALKVSQNSSTNTTSSIDTTNISTDDFSSSTVNNSLSNNNNQSIASNSTTLYCDYRKVKINNNIKSETKKEYIINITKSEINNINKDIVTINNTTINNRNLINMANGKINNLNSQLKYEIKDEQTITEQEITSYKSNIADSEQQNATLQITKSSLVDKINKLNKMISDIKQSEVKAKVKAETKIKPDNSYKKFSNILVMLQNKQEKQQEYLNQIKLKHNIKMNNYKDNYELFMIEVEKYKNIQEFKKSQLAIQKKKKSVKKVAPKAPKKAV